MRTPACHCRHTLTTFFVLCVVCRAQVLDMFGVTPAFQGEEEDLPRSRSSSLTLASMSEVSPRYASHSGPLFLSIASHQTFEDR